MSGYPDQLRPRPRPQQKEPLAGDVRNGGTSAAAASGQPRAERFEDEKQRIIQGCFSKKDVDGSGKRSCLISQSNIFVQPAGLSNMTTFEC